ncbi:MAG: type II secretion system F family protein [Candidatus Marsarchaeota archaeon]|nr:type II secretion system F family protein [Candidatus Marsarchaeota archaeon]MCL5112757.1 type II secretion system F family protein [Candidatus Marsarchaeota archaeon]
MAIRFEMLVSRNLSRKISKELDLAGVKIDLNKVLGIAITGAFLIIVLVSLTMFLKAHLSPAIDVLSGIGAAGLFIGIIFMILEYMIDGRKSRMEVMLPDYFQIASANLRSGIALDRSLLLAARPEFKFFSDDIRDMNRRIFGGETLEVAMKELGEKYRSFQLQHSLRMVSEALRYGGAMADLLDQISKDLRSQQTTQKEISGQLFMYSIFIAFAGVIAAPLLYGLTSQMITVTDTVWKGILAANPGGLPTAGVSFLKPSPPKITPSEYQTFSIIAIFIITGFASLIMSTINSGSPLKGLRTLPLFIAAGIGMYIVIGHVIALMFSSIAGGV